MPSRISHSPSASRCRVIPLGRTDEPSGSLCVAEVGQHISFEVERVYWLFDVPGGGMRANHAHREQHEVLIAARGSFTVHCDDGDVRTAYVLDSPDTGLLVPPMVFHHLDDFSPSALCLALASGTYDRGHYVCDYDEFLGLVGGR